MKSATAKSKTCRGYPEPLMVRRADYLALIVLFILSAMAAENDVCHPELEIWSTSNFRMHHASRFSVSVKVGIGRCLSIT